MGQVRWEECSSASPDSSVRASLEKNSTVFYARNLEWQDENLEFHSLLGTLKNSKYISDKDQYLRLDSLVNKINEPQRNEIRNK